jgi:hypothetical protein
LTLVDHAVCNQQMGDERRRWFAAVPATVNREVEKS